ncbi:hypothetical protein ACQ4PT_011631 [Festuca glaucescens]
MAFPRDVPLSNQDEKEDMIRFDLEVCLFCEQICKEMKKLLSSFPTSTEEEKQHRITVLQSVSDAISRFCDAHGQPATELEDGHQATMPLVAELETNSDEGQAATELDTEVDSMESEEKEQESSDSLEVEEGRGKIDAVSRRATETEEAPWFDIYYKEIKGIQWPLKVYGVVAGRDDVDKHRNPLFFRSRDNYQIVHQKDRFLQLTGPCRAIVSEEPVEIEVRLRVNRGNKSDDRPLISDVYYYNTDYAHLLGSSDVIENHLCKIELSYQQLPAILGFDVGEPSPFEHGVKVVYSPLSQGSIEDVAEHKQVVLFDSRYGRMTMGKCAYLNLSRHVVSVELQGKLGVLIQAYAPSGGIAANDSVFIRPQKCHTSQHTCDIGGSEVKFTVAWSLLLADKTLWLMNGYADPCEDLPPFDPSLLDKLRISE